MIKEDIDQHWIEEESARLYIELGKFIDAHFEKYKDDSNNSMQIFIIIAAVFAKEIGFLSKSFNGDLNVLKNMIINIIDVESKK